MKLKTIPQSVLNLLALEPRSTVVRVGPDHPSRYTSRYVYRPDSPKAVNNGLRHADVRELVADGVLINDWRGHGDAIAINDGEQHALLDFCSEVYDAWSKFQGRLELARNANTREAAHKLLCQLGTHPTYTGFQMLQAKGSNLTIVGPFFEPASLDAMLSELAKTIMQAGSQARHANERDIADYRISLDYLTTQADWSNHFFGTKIDRGKIAEIQAMVDEIERRRGAASQAPC